VLAADLVASKLAIEIIDRGIDRQHAIRKDLAAFSYPEIIDLTVKTISAAAMPAREGAAQTSSAWLSCAQLSNSCLRSSRSCGSTAGCASTTCSKMTSSWSAIRLDLREGAEVRRNRRE